MMTRDELEAKYAELDAQYDATYEGLDDVTPEDERLRSRLIWEMVQVDIALGEEYGEDDIANYRAAAV